MGWSKGASMRFSFLAAVLAACFVSRALFAQTPTTTQQIIVAVPLPGPSTEKSEGSSLSPAEVQTLVNTAATPAPVNAPTQGNKNPNAPRPVPQGLNIVQ